MHNAQDDDHPLGENATRLAGLLLQKLALQACADGHPPELERDGNQNKALKGTLFDAAISGQRHVPDMLVRLECAAFKCGDPAYPWASQTLAVMLVDADTIPDALAARSNLSRREMDQILGLYDLYDNDVLVGAHELYPALNAQISAACAAAGYPDVNAASWTRSRHQHRPGVPGGF